ncbi:uncharacterized protein M6B38_251775 [Iris pallida]|uniref:Uncharacterized protein n=1 Tax=Iris pallida TaxID=29817 RepID=A0AAX6IJL0_IRIPA|nr:uncharacterized protein M6B38_251775 [Iris pallida]
MRFDYVMQFLKDLLKSSTHNFSKEFIHEIVTRTGREFMYRAS